MHSRNSPFCSVWCGEFGTFYRFIFILDEGVVADGPQVVAFDRFDDGSGVVGEGHVAAAVLAEVGLLWCTSTASPL